MNASSDAARTSLASAPMATPIAPNASAPKPSATTHSGARPQARWTPTIDSPASSRKPDERRAHRREPDLLGQQAGPRHQAAHEPAERVLLALERERPGGQQQRHEHQRDRDGDHDRERAERLGAALDHGRLDGQRRARPRCRMSSDRSRFSDARLAKRITWSSAGWIPPARSRGCPRGSAPTCSSPRMLSVAPEQLDRAAVGDQPEVVERDPGQPLGQRGVGLLHLRLDRVLDERALGRVLGVVVDLDGRPAERARTPRPAASA